MDEEKRQVLDLLRAPHRVGRFDENVEDVEEVAEDGVV